MRAVTLTAYMGDSLQKEELSVKDVPIPQPGEGEVQIKVSASSVNPIDWKVCLSAAVVPMRMGTVLGSDVAGVVTAVGSGVTRLAVGDEVWAVIITPGATGFSVGGYGEYVVHKEASVGLKPKNLSFQQAGVVPMAARTAVQCLNMFGDESKSVLILGGSSSVGIAAIQIAKQSGKKVYATCSTRNVEFVTSLGVDEVVDYRVSDWAEVLKDKGIDSVYDAVGEKDAMSRAEALLTDGGKFVTIVAPVPQDHVPPRGIKANFLFADSSGHADLDQLKFLCENDLLSMPIEKVFELDQIFDAFSYSMTGKAVGKIAVQVSK